MKIMINMSAIMAMCGMITHGDRFIHCTDDGLPFDPWMRVHARLGAKIIKECSRSMVLAGAVEEWERWSGMKFPSDGDYVAPTLLATLHVNHGANECIYVEPNIWMEHILR
jgi:hypothetical protein